MATVQPGSPPLFTFDRAPDGSLANSAVNVESLRQLWLDRTLIKGEEIGPGDPGDFDFGAWHIACHLAGAGGVRRGADGRLMWLEISHDPARDDYFASVTSNPGRDRATLRLDSAEGRTLIAGSTLVGFVEGNSTGRTSARNVHDSPTRFNLWRRQDFDEPVGSDNDGGKVWEHWCTQRDIRKSSAMGTSVLSAYISLVAALGDQFVAAVARGRRDYGHPQQLAAMVRAGFVRRESALWDTSPLPLPPAAERALLEAEPARALEAVEQLDWKTAPCYYMFRRRIDSWNPAGEMRRLLS
jgi:hypothetical protein